MEKKMENEMESVVIEGFEGFKLSEHNMGM